MAPLSRLLRALPGLSLALASAPAGLAQPPAPDKIARAESAAFVVFQAVKGDDKPAAPCPYNAKTARPAGVGIDPAVLIQESPLANLDKLRRAERLLKEASALAAAGDRAAAARKWDEVQQLCPGSRYAGTAQELLAQARPVPAGAEESVTPPMPAVGGESAGPALPVCLDFQWKPGVGVCGRAVLFLEDARLGLVVRPGSAVEVELSIGGACVGNWLRVLFGDPPK